MSTEFELSRELIDQIIFGMENQNRDFVIDPQSQIVIPRERAEQEQVAYIGVPAWRSVDGYNVMERFVATLHNPIFRQRLREILASGRGVFRQFKNALKERPDIERLWFGFKEREMRRVVVGWYNELREQWGLERVEPEGEPTDLLVLTDFSVRPATDSELARVTELDIAAYDEVYADEHAGFSQYLRRLDRAGLPDPDEPGSIVWGAATPADEFAGFLWSVEHQLGREETERSQGVAIVAQLYVLPEYRGLGLARALLEHYCVTALARGVDRLYLKLSGAGLAIEESIQRAGYGRNASQYWLDLPRWHRSNSVV